MRESITIATNAAINLLQVKIWLNIIGECLKKSNTFVVNVIKNFLRENILQTSKVTCRSQIYLHIIQPSSNFKRKYCSAPKGST